MMHYTKHFGSIGCWLLLAATGAPLGAQDVPDSIVAASLRSQGASVVRVHLGVGVGGMEEEVGLAARLGVTFTRGENHSITVRTATVEEFDIFGPSPSENVWDLGVLYGVQHRGKWAYAYASGGLALTGGTRRGERITPVEQCTGDPLACALGSLFSTVEYEEKPFHTVGFPVEVEAGVTLSRNFGLSASAWANFNPERSMTGFTVGLLLGNLR